MRKQGHTDEHLTDILETVRLSPYLVPWWYLCISGLYPWEKSTPKSGEMQLCQSQEVLSGWAARIEELLPWVTAPCRAGHSIKFPSLFSPAIRRKPQPPQVREMSREQEQQEAWSSLILFKNDNAGTVLFLQITWSFTSSCSLSEPSLLLTIKVASWLFQRESLFISVENEKWNKVSSSLHCFVISLSSLSSPASSLDLKLVLLQPPPGASVATTVLQDIVRLQK